jgi:hypothetical protein
MQDGPLQRYRPMVFKGAQELAAEIYASTSWK